MNAATFSCDHCRTKFHVINISANDKPKYCDYCGNSEIEPTDIILC
jgi:NAD-dependent SIR2 family protein deacetylase